MGGRGDGTIRQGCRQHPGTEQLNREPVPELTAQLGAPIRPLRAVTVAELICRLNWDGRTALLRVVRPAEDSLSVEELLRREGRWGTLSHTRHVADPAPPRRSRHSRTPSSGTPIVAPPPLHSTVRPEPQWTATAADSCQYGLGPLAVLPRQPSVP
jgi:hypothetical protein